MTELDQWVAWRIEEDERLYKQYGKPLEREHAGEYAAIGSGGQTILGKDDNEVFGKAIEAFGSGNFGFFRVGHSVLEKWLSVNH